jgi:signal transduction histidine kinase
MANVFARSGAKAINLFHKYLFRTQLALAIFYFLVTAVLLGISSEITRIVFIERISHRFEDHPTIAQETELRRATPASVREELQNVMLAVNGILLTLAGIMGYFLAGLTLDPLKKSYEKEQRFLSDASHELRTPLTILRTSLENLETKAEGTTKKDMRDAIEEVDHMHHLLQNLLVLSRAQQNLPITSVSLNALLKHCIERMQIFAEKEKQTLFLKEDGQYSIEGNERVLEQAITNVIENAITYNKPKGNVTIHLFKRDKYACIAISDTGIGMTEEEIAQSTERFYRAEESRTRTHGGSGLGLAITQQIIELHKGKLEITSKIHKGTVVMLNLPIHKAS